MSLKDNLQVQSQGLVVAIQEALFGAYVRFKNLPSALQVIAVLLLLTATVGTVAIRYGFEHYLSLQYKQEALLAHASYSNPEDVSFGKVTVLKNTNGIYSAFAVVSNPNLDLGTSDASYTFSFFNAAREKVYTSTGKTYLLPNEKKWLVVPRMESSQVITSGELVFEPITWQKKLATPDIDLKMNQPYVYEMVNPLAVAAEGAVVNTSPYALMQVRLVFVLYDKAGEVLAVTQRDEFSLSAFERRAYKLQWPGLYQADVDRIEMQAYTNTMDPKNISVSTNPATVPNNSR